MVQPLWQKSYPKGINWELDELPDRPIYCLLDNAVQSWPKQVLCEFMGKKITYEVMADLVDRAAKGLQDLGVKPGVHVGLYLPNTPHYIVAFFAVLKAGGVVVNYSPLDAEKELTHKIADSETDFLITLDLKLLFDKISSIYPNTRVKKLIVGSLTDFLPFPKNLLFPLVKGKEIAKVPDDSNHVRFRSLIANDGKFDAVAFSNAAETLAVLQYTGGTTGLPKGAMLTHRNLSAATQQLRQWTQGDPPILHDGQEKVLAVLPMFHIYALTVILLLGIRSGTEIILHPRFELDAVIKDIASKKPTVFPGVPTMYTAILQSEAGRSADLSSLKMCNSGGAPLPPEVQQQFEASSGCRLVEGWGMTETCAPGTANSVYSPPRPGSAGLPVPAVTIEFVDVDEPEKLLAYGETGEICVSGPNVMKGYWNKPEETEEAFLGGRFHTGDIGYMDDDGYVFIVDRKKDMILSGGFNVYPRVIEDAIYQHESVSEVTVIGIDDSYRGQAAKAFVKLKDGAAPFTLDELRSFLEDKLGRHEQPQALEIRDELPKTMVGKLSKKELVEEERNKQA